MSSAWVSDPSEENVTLELVRTLCDRLEADGIEYCHFKSNWELDRSASGENDLDLLIGTSDVGRFAALLRELGFKGAIGRPSQRFPGVAHLYGLDVGSGRFVHVHAHHRLVIGDDMTKNYRLPIEEAYLASATRGSLFRVPLPEFEFVLLVVRLVLKHCAVDAVLSDRRRLSAKERRELEHLGRRADPERVRQIVGSQELPFDQALFERCIRALERGASLLLRMTTASRLQRRLAAYGRHGQLVDATIKVWRRQSARARRRVLGRTRKRLDRGRLIAVVGGDGSGKTTAVEELDRWLGATFRTSRVHLGRPPRSVTTIVVRAGIRGARTLGLISGKPLKGAVRSAEDGGVPGRGWLLARVLTARDRYRTSLRARRFATRGGIVICDRYPLQSIRTMDQARTTWLLDSAELGRAGKRLVEWERRYYERIPDPDVLVVLRVRPDIAVLRKTEDPAGAVRERNAEVWDREWTDPNARVVDASRDKSGVLSDIKSWVWSRL